MTSSGRASARRGGGRSAHAPARAVPAEVCGLSAGLGKPSAVAVSASARGKSRSSLALLAAMVSAWRWRSEPGPLAAWISAQRSAAASAAAWSFL